MNDVVGAAPSWARRGMYSSLDKIDIVAKALDGRGLLVQADHREAR